MPTTIKLADDGVLTIELPGLTAVRIDAARRLVAVDGINSSGDGTSGPSGEAWTVADLRDGTYGGFHRLRPAAECIDTDCIERGEHDGYGAAEGTETR